MSFSPKKKLGKGEQNENAPHPRAIQTLNAPSFLSPKAIDRESIVGAKKRKSLGGILSPPKTSKTQTKTSPTKDKISYGSLYDLVSACFDQNREEGKRTDLECN
jgi:hypothetical protein